MDLLRAWHSRSHDTGGLNVHSFDGHTRMLLQPGAALYICNRYQPTRIFLGPESILNCHFHVYAADSCCRAVLKGTSVNWPRFILNLYAEVVAKTWIL